ncbi:hypothetical protein PF010_g25983 [Phytophthora fragariae]|uniref:Uncharacterized protein n=1 Tax=Phytophthora fragariae TaxID=53985 RepID=A0A6G0JY93_9STRA|nr:hypothetical protein PF010_g25983 [Phytophthora fragariae]
MRRWAQARSRSTPFSTWLRPAAARGCVRQRSVVASGGGAGLRPARRRLAAVCGCVWRGDVRRRSVVASGGGAGLRVAAARGCVRRGDVRRRCGVAFGGGEVIASGGSDLEMKG